MVYFDGFVQKGDWDYERWQGYETDGLWGYGREFLDSRDERPFCLFLAAPAALHAGQVRARALLRQAARNAGTARQRAGGHARSARSMYRHYLAMILAVDDMVGEALAISDRTGLAETPW